MPIPMPQEMAWSPCSVESSLQCAGFRPAQAREEISRLDDALYSLWNLGDNVIIAWTIHGKALRFLSVRHYAIPEAIHADTPRRDGMTDTVKFINSVLSGPIFLGIPSEDLQAFSAAGA